MSDAGSAEEAKDLAAAGDNVVLWGSYTQMFSVVLQPGAITNNRFGSFHHEDLIGRPFGSKVRARKGGAWLAMLRPSPELITQSLVHRTQIIYHADISLLLVLLDARPGKVFVEAGTGSGSVSASFARALRPGGRLHTFEFHEDRQRQALEEFRRFHLDDIVVSHHRDVCADGLPKAIGRTVHGVFLDLPAPWLALPHMDCCLYEGGRICTFSPCIEQVDRTAAEFRRLGYHDIRMFETLAVNWGVKAESAIKKRRIGGRASAALASVEGSSGGASGSVAQGHVGSEAPGGWLSYQMPMRSHTGYLLVATKAPDDEPGTVKARDREPGTANTPHMPETLKVPDEKLGTEKAPDDEPETANPSN